MNILRFLFGASGGRTQAPEICSAASNCELQEEQRRTDAFRAYAEEHLFGYVDSDGNFSDRPGEPRK